MTAVRHTLEDGILTVTFANPPEGVFTGAMAEKLLALLPAMAAGDVRTVILQGGVPGVFIRHYSVAEQTVDLITRRWDDILKSE